MPSDPWIRLAVPARCWSSPSASSPRSSWSLDPLGRPRPDPRGRSLTAEGSSDVLGVPGSICRSTTGSCRPHPREASCSIEQEGVMPSGASLITMSGPWGSAETVAAHLRMARGSRYLWTERRGLSAHGIGCLWSSMPSELGALGLRGRRGARRDRSGAQVAIKCNDGKHGGDEKRLSCPHSEVRRYARNPSA